MNISTKRIPQSYLALSLGLVALGLSPILIKLADAPGIISSFYRFLIGTILLTIPFLYNLYKNRRGLPIQGIILASLAGFCFATDMSIWTTGIMFGNATLPTLTGNLTPLWVGIGAIFLFHEKQKPGFWIGLFLALFGVTLMIVKDLFQPNGFSKGMIYGVFAGMFYASYYLLAQPGRKKLDTISFLYISTVVTTVVLGIYAWSFHLPFSGYSNTTWTYFIIMGLFIQAGGWFLINYVQGYLAASTISATLLGQPIIAGIIEGLWLGGKFTYYHVVGGIVIIVGIYIVLFSRNRKM